METPSINDYDMTHLFFKNFYWSYLQLGHFWPLFVNRLADYCILNKHHYRVAKFQNIIKTVYKNAPSQKLKDLFYDGPFTMAFFLVKHIDPMPIQGYIYESKDFITKHFGNYDKWFIFFQNSEPAIITQSKEPNKWEVQAENINTFDAIVEVLKF